MHPAAVAAITLLGIAALAALETAVGGWGTAIVLANVASLALAWAGLRALAWSIPALAGLGLAYALSIPNLLFLPLGVMFFSSGVAATVGELAGALIRRRRG